MKFGYACINMTLSGLPKSKRVTTNRSMIKRTFKQKGIAYASELGLLNCKDLYKILEWVGGIADQAQRVGARLEVMLSRS